MRRNRLIWGIVWIISIVGISFFGGTVSYGFFIAVTLLPIVSVVYLLYVYFCFHIYQELGTRTIVVNQKIPFFFRLVNEYWFSFVGVKVRFYSSFSTIEGLSDDIEYELLPGTDIKKETGIICRYRGEYKVGIKYVEIQDFLRLFKFSYHNPETLGVIM